MVAQIEIDLRIHHFPDSRLNVIIAYIAPCHRSVAGTDNIGESSLLIAPGARDDESDLHIAVIVHPLGQTIGGGAQTAQDMRGKLPPEH